MPHSHSYHHQARSSHPTFASLISSLAHFSDWGKIKKRWQGKLSITARRLTIINIILAVAASLGSFFVNIYLWRQSNDLAIVVYFSLIQYPIIPIFYLIIGKYLNFLKARSTIAIGFLLYALTYSLFAVLGEDIVKYVWYVGALSGLANSFYWVGHNNLEYKTTLDDNRDLYFGVNASWNYIIAVISPFIAGLILHKKILSSFFAVSGFDNYYILFALMGLIFFIGTIYSLHLPPTKTPKLHLSLFKQFRKSKVWRIISWREFLDGIKGGSEGYVAAVLIAVILVDEFNIGLYTSIFSLLSAVISLALGMIVKHRDRLTAGKWGAWFLFLARAIYMSFFNMFGFLVSAFVKLLALPLFGVGMAATLYDAIDHSPKHENDYFTYLTLREIPLAIGRTLSAVLFILFLKWLNNDIGVARIWLMVFGLLPLTYYYLTKRFEKKFD